MLNVKMPHNINLADPEFHKSQKVDMLIGAEIYFDLICIGQIKSTKDCPTLQKTQLGWIVSGKTYGNYQGFFTICNLNTTNDILYNQIKMFWELEEVTFHKPLMSKE